jgi:hypothetical protein
MKELNISEKEEKESTVYGHASWSFLATGRRGKTAAVLGIKN